eukprot:6487935-Amphidinium_carterae.1
MSDLVMVFCTEHIKVEYGAGSIVERQSSKRPHRTVSACAKSAFRGVHFVCDPSKSIEICTWKGKARLASWEPKNKEQCVNAVFSVLS